MNITLSDLIQLFVGGLTMGCIYGLVALGFHIVYVSTGLINFATGEQVVLGGLLALLFSVVFKLNLVFTFLLVAILAALFGLLFERFVIRPAMKTSELSVIIATIALSIILLNSNIIIWGKEHLYFPPFIEGDPVMIKGAVIDLQTFWIIGLTLFIVVVLKLFLDYTFQGKVIKCAADNMRGAKVVGINTTRTIARVFALSTIITALAGVIVAPITYAGGTIGTMLAIKGFISAILGGISRSVAVVLGGILLGVLEMFIAGFISSGYRDAIAIFIFMIILIIRPKGVFIFGGDEE